MQVHIELTLPFDNEDRETLNLHPQTGLRCGTTLSGFADLRVGSWAPDSLSSKAEFSVGLVVNSAELKTRVLCRQFYSCQIGN